MRKTLSYLAVAVLVVGVLIPGVAWWADGGNQRQVASWFSGPSKPPQEEGGIRVAAEPIQASDVAAALDTWMWKLKIDVPRDTGWKHAWLVVKKKGETAEVLHGGPLHRPDGQPGSWECFVAVIPTALGATVMGCDKVTITLNGMHGQVIDNPFKAPAGGMAMRSPKPKFLGNQAILAIVRQARGSGIGLMDSEEDLKRIPEYDSVLMMVLTESLDPPPVTAKK
jgi:hypothetical protein